MQHLTTLDEFQAEVTHSGHDCVVDYYATWCGPCKVIAPVFEDLAATTRGVFFYKVNVDEASDIAQAQGIRAMPTFVFYRNGAPVMSVSGANKALLQERMKAFVESA